MDKFIARTTTVFPEFFITNETKVTNNYEEAHRFDTIGACMKACITVNERMGQHLFTVFRITKLDE